LNRVGAVPPWAAGVALLHAGWLRQWRGHWVTRYLARLRRRQLLADSYDEGRAAGKSPAQPHMREDIEALYQAVQRNEAHAATINRLLDVLLRRPPQRTRKHGPCAHRLESELDYYTEQLGALHAERDQLRRKIHRARAHKKRPARLSGPPAE
jgi:hypothetical protein